MAPLVALQRRQPDRPEPPAPRPGALSPWQLAQRLWTEIWEDEVFDRAAALSYYLLFALFPMLLFLTAVLGLLPLQLMDVLMRYLGSILPGDTVQRTMAEITRGASGKLLSVGIAMALWSASSGMGALMVALNVAFDVRERRSWWKLRLTALALTAGMTVFVPTALLLLLYGERIGYRAAGWLGLGTQFAEAWALARWPIIIVLVAIGTGLIYHLAPAHRPRWRWFTPGSVFAVVAWVLLSLGLRLYINTIANYNATYGSIGGVILLLLWLYLTGVALLVGAEIDAEFNRARYGRAAGHDADPAAAPPRPAS